MTKEQIEKLGITYKEGMTDDEVIGAITALHAKNTADLNAELKNHKELLSKRNSEIAEFKRKETEKLSADEKAKLEYSELQTKYDELNKRVAVAEKEASYVSLGYSAELAKKIASAEVEGKSTVEYQQEFLKAHDEALKAQLMKDTPNPQGKTDPNMKKAYTAEGFRKGEYTYDELVKLQSTNPTLYAEITK